MSRFADGRIGSIAVAKGLLSRTDLDRCLREQAQGDVSPLGQVMIRLGLLTTRQLFDVVLAQAGLPLLQRYELLDVLGEGGMAVVYRARDRQLDREVAIKTLQDSLCDVPLVREFFRREARVMAALSHPNLVSVLDAIETGHDHRLYIVLELVEGVSLDRLLGERPHQLRTLVTLLRKAADGLGLAHARGIVHRDLKPGNILVTDGGEPKVTDFGLALQSGAGAPAPPSDTVLGTPPYSAPEQHVNRPQDVSPRSDVFALGAILHEIVTGRPPPRALVGTTARPVVSGDLGAVIAKALKPDPRQRYATTAAFAADLHRWLAGEPVTARDDGGDRRSAALRRAAALAARRRAGRSRRR